MSPINFQFAIAIILFAAGQAHADDNAGVSGEKDFNMYCACLLYTSDAADE